MVEDTSLLRKLFMGFNYTWLCIMAFLCLFPIIHVLALSLSSATAVSSGAVTFWPVDFNTSAYEYVTRNNAFIASFTVSVKRVVLGSGIQMVLIVLLAYPLSKETKAFRFRTAYVWYFFITIIFGGGLIPAYMTVQKTGLIDSIGALVIPTAVPVFSVVLLLNFFRGLPKELEEAAFMDGAGYLTTLLKLYIPLSKPALATLLLFSIVGHWNSWFDGIIYMNHTENYPLQSYLQSIVIAGRDVALSSMESKIYLQLTNRSLNAAQIFLGALPILIVYPFLQKYFMKGIVLGSIKE
ncbi:carbohydrate ABC transporter permease [Paenibacillus eucommiae]|uniref:Aldouronate transport system permease protein n=1 Tax=Paenibacillus eucommiae TaxID=1355755 RepID=A0ABS4J017_9BACL|nr:carbohydrate ABC transporter permease [Paenibacillus eucommiae]MBP1993187.1 putative aldouronate transport system permease protein [Paenibacillus eucommiae]